MGSCFTRLKTSKYSVSDKIWAWSDAEQGSYGGSVPNTSPMPWGVPICLMGPTWCPRRFPSFSSLIYVLNTFMSCLHGGAWAAMSHLTEGGWINRLPTFSLETTATTIWGWARVIRPAQVVFVRHSTSVILSGCHILVKHCYNIIVSDFDSFVAKVHNWYC